MVTFYITLLLPLLGFILALYQIPKDMQIQKKDFGDKNKWQRLNSKGKKVVVIIFFTLFTTDVGLIIKGPDTNKITVVKVPSAPKVVFVSKAVRDHQFIKGNSVTNNYNDPVMDLLPGPNNPQISGTSMYSLKVQFDIGVINNGIAYDIRDRFIYFFIYNGNFKLIQITNRAFNESIKGYEESRNRISMPIFISPLNNVDTTYFYLRVLYSNKAVDGKIQYPIKKIFYLSLKHPFRSMNDITNFKEVENQDQYDRIKNKLVKEKYW